VGITTGVLSSATDADEASAASSTTRLDGARLRRAGTSGVFGSGTAVASTTMGSVDDAGAIAASVSASGAETVGVAADLRPPKILLRFLGASLCSFMFTISGVLLGRLGDRATHRVISGAFFAGAKTLLILHVSQPIPCLDNFESLGNGLPMLYTHTDCHFSARNLLSVTAAPLAAFGGPVLCPVKPSLRQTERGSTD
jgi:hypothetical protein